MNQLMTNMIYYLLAILGTFGLVQFLLRGFFFIYLKVKSSRGRKIIVEVKSVPSNYFKVGEVEEGFILFTDKTGDKRIAIPKNEPVFFHKLGVNWVYVDAEKNCLLSPDLKGIDGFDAVKYNDLYKRALYKPSILTADTKNVILWLLIAVIIGIGFLAFMQNAMSGDLTAIKASVTALQNANRTVIVTQGGVI